MKGKTLLFAALAVILLLFSGCANTGMFFSLNQTNVLLSKPNYQIVAKNVKGEAKAGYLFGVSYSIGATTETLALARIDGTGLLYKETLEDLWKSYEAIHGSVEGKKLALVNVRYDSDILNLLIYTEVKISVRADIVEFKE